PQRAAAESWSVRRLPRGAPPPAVRSAAVDLPAWIFFTSPAFVVIAFGTRQTLASYVSMHTVPDTTESNGHLLSGFAPCASAGVGRNAAPRTATPMGIPTHVRSRQ